MLGTNNDESLVVDALILEFGDDSSEGLVDEIEFTGEPFRRRAKYIQVTAFDRGTAGHKRTFRQLFANADSLVIESKHSGHADLLGTVVRITVNLVNDGLNVELVVALDVAEVGGPAIVERGIRKIHGLQPGNCGR